MARNCIRFGSALLLLFAAAAAPSGAVETSRWFENVSVLVRAGEVPSGEATVYDSEDYQQILVVFADRPTAAILDLGASTVFAIPRDSLKAIDDGVLRAGEVMGEYLAILDRKESVLSFFWNEIPISVEPLPPTVGPVKLDRLVAFKPGYATAARAYRPSAEKVAMIGKVDSPTEIRVYFGTWCLLCKKLVPPLIATLEQAKNTKISVHYIAMDENLSQPKDEIARHRISKTPTILVLREGREIGRIEEKAAVSLEADLAAILTRR